MGHYLTLHTHFDHGVLTLTMNRPEKRNALNPEMMVELTQALNKAASDPACEVILLTGAGEATGVVGPILLLLGKLVVWLGTAVSFLVWPLTWLRDQIQASLHPVWSDFAATAMIVSALVVGGFTPGIVPLVLGRIHEFVPHSSAGQRAAWAQATTTFALFQAAGAYGLSYLFERSDGDYAILFVTGASAVTASLAIDLVTALTIGRQRSRRDTAA